MSIFDQNSLVSRYPGIFEVSKLLYLFFTSFFTVGGQTLFRLPSVFSEGGLLNFPPFPLEDLQIILSATGLIALLPPLIPFSYIFIVK